MKEGMMEKNSSENREIHKSLLEEKISKLKQEIDLVGSSLVEAEKLIEKTKDPTVLSKIRNYTYRFVKTSGGIIALTTLSLGLNHLSTHQQEVSLNKNKDTELPYSHPDEETTKILNYMSGRDTLSYEEMSKMFKAENPNAEIEDYEKKYGEQWLDSMFVRVPEISDNAYRAIWELEKESGSPKIRWNVGRKATNDPYYNPLSNTIYISPLTGEKSIEEINRRFLGELPHSQQFSKEPVQSYLKSALGYIRTGGRIVENFFTKDGKKINYLYGVEYRTPGSLEHDAHSVIEPSLNNKFEEAIKNQDEDRFY